MYSNTVQKGRVVSSDPGIGDRVLDGDKVAIVLSKGKEVYDLPKLAGLTVDAAQDKLFDTKLAFGKVVERFSESVEKGIVIASDPKAGTTLRPGAIVDLIVSMGRQPIPVGDWVGKDADKADQDADRAWPHRSSAPRSTTTTSPPGWSSLRPRTAAPCSRARRSVPRLARPRAHRGARTSSRTASRAPRRKLEGLGFVVDTREAPGYLGLGFVFSMNPDAGSEIPKGSTVIIYLI